MSSNTMSGHVLEMSLRLGDATVGTEDPSQVGAVLSAGWGSRRAGRLGPGLLVRRPETALHTAFL